MDDKDDKKNITGMVIGVNYGSINQTIHSLAKPTASDSRIPVEPRRARIIEGLEARYRHRYDQKLDERLPLNLQLRYTEEGTTHEYAIRYFPKDVKDILKHQDELAGVLKTCRYLLIIGEPGAGKTTILLKLADYLLCEAKKDKSLPIPIILNLASWRDKDTDFSQWFEDVLVQGNNFSRSLAKELIQTRQVLPLLDGFDEIGRSIKDATECESLRSACLVAVNHFMSSYEPYYLIICSRRDEYKSIAADAPVKAELSVEPLEVSQIKQALSTLAADSSRSTTHPFSDMTTAQNMLYWMEINPTFTRLIKTPFYFNLASQTFYHQDTNEKLPEEEGLSRYLLEKFIQAKFIQAEKHRKRRFRTKQTLYWLSWLAIMLRQRNEVAFELSLLQPSILSKPKRYSFIFNLIVGLIISFYAYSAFFLAASFLSVRDRGITIFVYSSILAGLIISLFSQYFNWGQADFKTEDIRQWKISNIKSKQTWINIVDFSLNAIVRNAQYGFIVGIFVGLIISLIDKSPVPLIGLPIKGALVTALAALCYGLMTGFSNEIRLIKDFYQTRSPLQKFRGGIVFASFKWMLILSSTSFMYDHFLERNEALTTAPVIYSYMLFYGILGLIAGFLLTPFFKHFILRCCFVIEGSIPFRYVAFLNYATELRILERDSGTWRFRHQILQDYFADQTPQRLS